MTAIVSMAGMVVHGDANDMDRVTSWATDKRCGEG